MKIPQAQYKGTQSLGRHDIAAVGGVASAIGQQGRVIQQGMGALADVTADYIKRKQNAEFDDQVASMGTELSDFYARHAAKQFYDSDELNSLPNNVVRLTDTTTDDSGNEISTPRNAIPAHEVFPHLLQAKLQGMINNKADKISNKDLRNEFIRRADVDGANRLMNATVAAEESQQAYKAAVDDAAYKEASDAGKIVEARFIIENSEATELAKQQMIKDAENRVSVNYVLTAIRSADPEVVMEARQMLLDPSLPHDLTEAQRQAGLRDLDARLNVLTLGWGDEEDRLADIEFSQFIMATAKGEVTAEQIEARHQLWVDNPKAKGGYDIKQYERAHSVLRGYESGQEQDAIRARNEQRYQDREARRIANEAEADSRRLEGEVEADRKATAVALRADQKIENDIYYNNYIKMAREGGATMISVEREDALYQSSKDAGAITPYALNPGQATVIRNIITNGKAKEMELAISVEGGRMMVMEGARSNPGNPDHQTRIDDYTESMGYGNNVQEMVNIAAITSIMSQQLQDIIAHGALNQDAQSGQPALQAFGALKDQASDSLNKLAKPERDFLEDAWAYHRVGGDAVRAFELAQINKEVPVEVQEAHTELYRTEKYAGGNAADLTTRMKSDEAGRYPFDPTSMPLNAYKPPVAMQRGYNIAVATNFQRHGDIKLARDQAWSLMHETWAASGVGMALDGGEASSGSRVVQRGVEQVLGIDTDTGQWRLNAFAEFYNQDPENIVLASDGLTARDKHTWQVLVLDPVTGAFRRLAGEFPGTELRFDGTRWADEGAELRWRTKAAEQEQSKSRPAFGKVKPRT